MSTTQERATYPLKIQAIRSKGQNLRFYVYLPMPLAAALGIDGGCERQSETVAKVPAQICGWPV